MKKIISIGLLCIMSLSMFTSCGKPNLEGNWEICDSNGEDIECDNIKFEDDGIVEFDDEKGEYKVIDDDTVKITINDKDYECDFKIINEDEKLIYLGEFSDKLLIGKLNSVANSIMKGANTVITDMDVRNIFYEGNAVICSDKSKNINSIPKNADENFDFVEALKEYIGSYANYEYIIAIKDDYCFAVAVANSSDKNIIGTYPPKGFEGMNFDEFYEKVKDDIK